MTTTGAEPLGTTAVTRSPGSHRHDSPKRSRSAIWGTASGIASTATRSWLAGRRIASRPVPSTAKLTRVRVPEADSPTAVTSTGPGRDATTSRPPIRAITSAMTFAFHRSWASGWT
ncbi:MAG: hypothetical protein LPK92_11440 [Actinomycetes bacterium]|nr:hypothetical protein [Actinomycetes bacterium]